MTETAKKLLDISYSSANSWDQGYKEDALTAILKVGEEREPTEPMKLGRKWHEVWEEETKRTKQVPALFGYKLPGRVRAEQRYQLAIPTKHEYDIRITGVLDIETEDGLWIADHKCGKTEVEKYLNSQQIGIYALLRPMAEVGIYNTYNPYTKKAEVFPIIISQAMRDEASEWIKKIAHEVYEHCQAEGMPFWRIVI